MAEPVELSEQQLAELAAYVISQLKEDLAAEHAHHVADRAAMEALFASEVTARSTADSALDARLDALEAIDYVTHEDLENRDQ